MNNRLICITALLSLLSIHSYHLVYLLTYLFTYFLISLVIKLFTYLFPNLGAIITTTESLIFELLGDSLDPQFKAISVLLKDRKTKINEFENDTFTC